jgi:hypothetical protein
MLLVCSFDGVLFGFSCNPGEAAPFFSFVFTGRTCFAPEKIPVLCGTRRYQEKRRKSLPDSGRF